MKTAIIFSGIAYNFRFSIPSLMQNLIKVNDADVFILIQCSNQQKKSIHTNDPLPLSTHGTAWEKKAGTMYREDVEITRSDIECIQDTFGYRLKTLQFIEDDSNYMEHLHRQRTRLMKVINDYREESAELGLPLPFGSDVATPDNGNVKCVLDQYHHVKQCYTLMEEFEKEFDVKYDVVARVRMDFYTPKPFNFRRYLSKEERSVCLCGSVRGSVPPPDEFEWADDFCFFANRQEAGIFFSSLDRMGFIVGNRDRTVYLPQNNDFVFAPETQISLLLRELQLPVKAVDVHRNPRWTDGKDGWDYVNYEFREGLDYRKDG